MRLFPLEKSTRCDLEHILNWPILFSTATGLELGGEIG
jgi:hypothetical protein